MSSFLSLVYLFRYSALTNIHVYFSFWSFIRCGHLLVRFICHSTKRNKHPSRNTITNSCWNQTIGSLLGAWIQRSWPIIRTNVGYRRKTNILWKTKAGSWLKENVWIYQWHPFLISLELWWNINRSKVEWVFTSTITSQCKTTISCSWRDLPFASEETHGRSLIFRNDGDWIIQKVFANSDFIQGLVTPEAPLSTVRIITSRDATSSLIKVKTMVFRAGRSGERTDHTAIFYNIHSQTHRLSAGSTNRHWYQRGWKSFDTKSMWLDQNFTLHPDSNAQLENIKWPNVPEMIECVSKAHRTLCPDVPIIGWDVAWTNENNQLMLLELNISCNFFNGFFDASEYTNFCYDWFHVLDHWNKSCFRWIASQWVECFYWKVLRRSFSRTRLTRLCTKCTDVQMFHCIGCLEDRTCFNHRISRPT